MSGRVTGRRRKTSLKLQRFPWDEAYWSIGSKTWMSVCSESLVSVSLRVEVLARRRAGSVGWTAHRAAGGVMKRKSEEVKRGQTDQCTILSSLSRLSPKRVADR